ncbi:MAG: DUF4416 family protein [candidate division WOR-3 bacterium]
MMTSVKFHSGIVVWGVITNDINLINNIATIISLDFGKIILRSRIIPFDYTNYYELEMGKNLNRQWLVTEKIIDLQDMSNIKLYAINLENKYKSNNKRKINIDPGFLTLSNFILVTTKNYAHRIYLKDTIYAEVTLIYKDHTFQALDWTYPDYRDNIDFFNQARSLYQQLIYEKS